VALSRNCGECQTDWPDSTPFAICPRCRVKTRTATCPKPLTPGEAKIQIRHIEFGRHYRQLEEKRSRLGQPSPEEIGKLEAEEISKQIREIRELPER
jgi:hypothetical protein